MTTSLGRAARRPDQIIRAAAAAVVVAEAAIAAAVSYSHIYELGRRYGQTGYAARLLPLSIDGLIVAASMVLLYEARGGRPAPFLARFLLWLGVGCTIAANGAAGARYGPLGAILSAAPAAAFVGAAELMMGMIRRGVWRLGDGQADELDPATPAAVLVFADELRGGQVPGLRDIRRELALGQPRAQRIRSHLAELASHPAAA